MGKCLMWVVWDLSLELLDSKRFLCLFFQTIIFSSLLSAFLWWISMFLLFQHNWGSIKLNVSLGLAGCNEIWLRPSLKSHKKVWFLHRTAQQLQDARRIQSLFCLWKKRHFWKIHSLLYIHLFQRYVAFFVWQLNGALFAPYVCCVLSFRAWLSKPRKNCRAKIPWKNEGFKISPKAIG